MQATVTVTVSVTTVWVSTRIYPTGTPPASRACAPCSRCAPPRGLLRICSRALSPARCLHRGHQPPSRLPARTLAPHRMLSFRLSVVRVGVQPAAELRHLQRHEHVRHVLCAPLSVLCPESAVEPSPLRPACTAVAPRSPVASRHPGRTSPLQPHNHVQHVLRALLPVPCPNLQSSPPLHAA